MNNQIMSTADKTFLVLGAGPAGLACAYQLLQAPGNRVIVLDRADRVGGFGASFNWGGHMLDYGPHTIHARGGEPESLIRELFKNDPGELIEGTKKVHVLLQGKRFRYPLQVREAFTKFNPFLSLRILIEFILTSLFHAIVSIPIENFENWGKKRFGPTLYRISFGDYTEKVWKIHPNKISPKFASEKIQGFNFIDLIRRLLKIGGHVTEPYFQRWVYHRHGCGGLFERFAEEVRTIGGKIELNASLNGIQLDDGRVISVQAKRGEEILDFQVDYVVNTIPLPLLIKAFDQKAPFVVRHAAGKLRYNGLILVFIEFDGGPISDDHWFYLLEKRFRFNRVTEQRNLSPDSIQAGKTVLMFEMTCPEKSPLWSVPDKELFEMAVEDGRSISFIPMELITGYTVKRIPHAYEVYYRDFDQYVDILLAYVRSIENLATIGRRGLFLQGDMYQSIEMGLAFAKGMACCSDLRNVADQLISQYVKFIDLDSEL